MIQFTPETQETLGRSVEQGKVLLALANTQFRLKNLRQAIESYCQFLGWIILENV